MCNACLLSHPCDEVSACAQTSISCIRYERVKGEGGSETVLKDGERDCVGGEGVNLFLALIGLVVSITLRIIMLLRLSFFVNLMTMLKLGSQ